jgi:sodium transport system ATP-binding protein
LALSGLRWLRRWPGSEGRSSESRGQDRQGGVMIEAKNLMKLFGAVKAVDGVSFLCRDGEVFALVGPNGAGKTTTLRILATVMKPDNGTAEVGGHDILQEERQVRTAIGVLPETVGLYDRMTPREHLLYFGRLFGVQEDVLEKRVEEVLAELAMTEYSDRRCGGFSKGMRQKAALARALVHDPKTMILDEPTAGLDVMSARSVREIIKRFRDEGRCVLLSTHLMSEAEQLCDRIAIIDQGRIKTEGSPDDLRAQSGESDLEGAFVKMVGQEGRAAQ